MRVSTLYPGPRTRTQFITIWQAKASDLTVSYLCNWLWLLPEKARIPRKYRELLGGAGIRRGWQLTWFTKSTLLETIPNLGEEGRECVSNTLSEFGTHLGQCLILPGHEKLQNRLGPILEKYSSSQDQARFEHFSRDALPLILDLDWVAR